MWKAGQCVTINGKTYRVTKLNNERYVCYFCAFNQKSCLEYPCNKCGLNLIMPNNCYLTRVHKLSDYSPRYLTKEELQEIENLI